MYRSVVTVLAALFLVSCSEGSRYTPPPAASTADNFITINKPRDVVWDQAVPLLGKNFYVINNLDKGSGLINVSYSGDPQKYIDCGKVTILDFGGKPKGSFPGAVAHTNYTTFVYPNQINVERTLTLEGRMNIILEVAAPSQTRVSANTRYVVSRQTTLSAQGMMPSTMHDEGSFNTNAAATIGQADSSIRCSANGKLEAEVLSLFRSLGP